MVSPIAQMPIFISRMMNEMKMFQASRAASLS